jgi:hypothetical protein
VSEKSRHHVDPLKSPTYNSDLSWWQEREPYAIRKGFAMGNSTGDANVGQLRIWSRSIKRESEQANLASAGALRSRVKRNFRRP